MLSNFSEFIKSNYYSVDLGLHFPLANIYACCFLKNTMTYFNLFVCPVKLRDISVMTRVSNVILLF